MSSYAAQIEIAGVPTVTMIYADQANFFENTALLNGCPGIRWIDVPRIGQVDEMIATFYNKLEAALTDPITADEQQTGLYSPPAPPRIAFEGTLDEAQDFFSQTTLVENCRNCPIATWTDGLPIIIPTEQKVAEMLTGTSHDPNDNLVSYRLDSDTGDFETGSEMLYARSYTATVEKAAICAVMAGCRPEYLPVALAIASTGGGSTSCPGTSSMFGTMYCVSGPIAKEIGMNAGQQSMDVGNFANMTLGRVGALITVNFGGCITGQVRTDSGNPLHSTCFAEDLEGLPLGWVGFNEEEGYSADQSTLAKISTQFLVTGLLSFPGYYRSLNSGTMGIARKLGVEGIPGKYNWMELMCEELVKATISTSGHLWILHPNLAELLYEHGFNTKEDAYQWLSDTYFITVEEYYNTGRWEFMVQGRTEPTSGLSWDELLATDPDYKLHAFGTPMSNCFIVADGFADEHWYFSSGGRPRDYPIDPWR
jgi:hypothetical protein